jgi:ABC-type transport system involved in cytochrome c biogenesis ATPase subunit
VRHLNALLLQHLQRGGTVLLTGHQATLAAALHARELDLDDCAT